MAYPAPQGYGTAAGSHAWQGRGVHAEGEPPHGSVLSLGQQILQIS